MQHVGPVIATNNELNVIDCQCGVAHLDPLPGQVKVESYYRNDRFYATHSPPEWFVRNKQEHVLGLWYPSYAYQNKLLSVKKWHGTYYPNVIDYGCGDGWWLEQYHRYCNQNSWGIEPSETARMLSPVMGRIAPTVDSLAYKRYASYNMHDSARVALVLEHVVDPRKTIMDIKNKFCGFSGKLLIIVPNEFNPLQRMIEGRIGKAWYIQQPHINYFTKDSIKELLQSCGFDITYQGGTFPMELFYLMGYHYIGNDEMGQKCHRIRLSFEHKFGAMAFRLYHVLYQTLGWGRETVIVGKANYCK